MKLRRFRAEGFRNIGTCDITFADGANLMIGGNAEGKTNAVEGIYLFSRGRSFRTSDDKELVGFGREGFRISVEYEDRDGVSTLEYALFGRQRQRKKNGYKLSSVAEMIGSFRSVLFYPDDLRLVKGEPEERRSFLNVAAAQYDPVYLSEYKSFKTALENRNALLKSASRGEPVDEGELIAWGEVMAKHSARIYLARSEYVERLSHYAAEHMQRLSGGRDALAIRHKSDIEGKITDPVEAEAEYGRIYTAGLERERIVGTSLWGPQRDDLVIELSGKAARSFSSQGQQRSIVLSLKLGEGEVIRERFGEYPVFLFDDVLSELDHARRSYLLHSIGGMQTIITSCEDIGIAEGANLINVEGGSYVPAHR